MRNKFHLIGRKSCQILYNPHYLFTFFKKIIEYHIDKVDLMFW